MKSATKLNGILASLRTSAAAWPRCRIGSAGHTEYAPGSTRNSSPMPDELNSNSKLKCKQPHNADYREGVRQRSEVGGQKSEVRSRRSVVGGRRSEDGGQNHSLLT